MSKKLPKKAKLMSDGGFYRFIPLTEFVRVINVPIIRKVALTEVGIDYSEKWHFNLVFSLERVLKGYAEYRQVDCIKVDSGKIK